MAERERRPVPLLAIVTVVLVGFAVAVGLLVSDAGRSPTATA